jgi:hypothetical protein
MYKRIPVKKLSGEELFINAGDKKFSVLEFWQYAFSNLNSNVLRGALAEFVIENALKDKIEIGVRNPWADRDVDFKGKKIEVKCCSYIQDWDQNELSRISWSGLKAKNLYWSSAYGRFQPDAPKDYKADVYILALLDHKEPPTLNILDMAQWRFYVLSKEEIKEISKNGNSVSLTRLDKLKLKSVGFNNIPKELASL